jgi:hypothetical protein
LCEGKIHNGDIEEIRDDGLQIHAYTVMMKLKKMNEASSDSGEIDPHLYRQLIGSLMYLVNTRPDICYVDHLFQLGGQLHVP